MNKILIARMKMYTSLDEHMKNILMREIWLECLRNNESDHLNSLYDLELLLSHFEGEEEYEACKAIRDTLDNYQQLSNIKLR